MAKRTRAQRKQHGGQRSTRRQAQPQSELSTANSRSASSQSAVDANAALAAIASKKVSRPTSRTTTKVPSKGKTPNVKRQSVNWESEYANVVNDLHMLMIVSILLFIVIIGAGSFIT